MYNLIVTDNFFSKLKSLQFDLFNEIASEIKIIDKNFVDKKEKLECDYFILDLLEQMKNLELE